MTQQHTSFIYPGATLVSFIETRPPDSAVTAGVEDVQPGVSTDEIDRLVHKMVVEAGAYPSPLRYGTAYV